MSPILVWGALAKSFDDPETIEEAIARMIDDHNDDVEAHLGENQALEAHRTNEVIDHPAESIVSDKLDPGAIDFYQFDPLSIKGIINYDSLDAFNNLLNAAISGYSNLYLNVGSTINTNARALLKTNSLRGTLGDDVYTYYNTFFKRSSTTNLTVWFGLGGLYEPFDVIEDIALGFKYLNGSLFCYWVTYDSGTDTYTEHTEEITGPSYSSLHSYSVIFDPVDSTARWYIDNELAHSEVITWGTIPSTALCYFIARNGANSLNGANFSTTTFMCK